MHERAPAIAGAAVECRANLADIACYEYGKRPRSQRTLSKLLDAAERGEQARDPLDRLLISQALVERLTVLTADSAFASYAVPVLDART